MSQSDTRKRIDIFHEFIYYVFDSILIPLIRGHFYVTESSAHRYRLFFFRHDVWRSLSEPQLASLKLTMLEGMQTEEAQDVLNSRSIGFSQIRLLPKETGVRPITNLRRRALKKGHKNVLGSSINSLLAPVYNMFTYESVSSVLTTTNIANSPRLQIWNAWVQEYLLLEIFITSSNVLPPNSGVLESHSSS
jgi:telomerase reverse transcriptase